MGLERQHRLVQRMVRQLDERLEQELRGELVLQLDVG